MDHQITMAAATNFDQENNQLLLNAIKNKFAAQSAHEAASFSPPKFTIPTLRTIDGAVNGKVVTLGASSPTNHQCNDDSKQLNQFLLKQLQQQQLQSNQETAKSNGFVLPQLQFGKEKILESNFEIPLLKSSTSSAIVTNSGVSSLTTAINKLQMQESDTTTNTSAADDQPATYTAPPAIDLTTALASKTQHHQGTPPTRDFQAKLRLQSSKTDFVIPFIDCDRLDNATARKFNLIPQNEHCLTDISQVSFKPAFKEKPSPIGQFLYLVDKRYSPLPLKCITTAQQYKLKVKHVVEPFQFDTKSPDDKVLQSLSKYGRR